MCIVAQKELEKMVRLFHSGNRIGFSYQPQQAGFTYLGILILLSISGVAMGGIGIVWHQQAQREREIELKFIGKAYQNAIGSYYESKVNGVSQFPQKLEDLVLDDRFQDVKRHIRRLYADPISPKTPWGLVIEKGRIIGVHSQSKKVMIQQASLKGEAKYSDLKFVYTPISKASNSPSQKSSDKLSIDGSANLSTELNSSALNTFPQIEENAKQETLNNVPTINGSANKKATQ